MGKCPDCGTWDSLDAYREPRASKSGSHDGVVEVWATSDVGDEGSPSESPTAIPLPEVQSQSVERISTRISEFDRVLGGGLVPGSVVLLGGDPGIGKSTLLLQVAGQIAKSGTQLLYVTSEESAYQLKLRADRIINDSSAFGTSAAGLETLLVLADTNLARIVEQARLAKPHVLVIDSIQMMYKADIEASPGSVTQLRRCCMELTYLAKVSGMTIILVGHITKDGHLAGPKLLEHLVDVVLTFEGDRHHHHRIVRSVKNRYGNTSEVGLFEMGEDGLREVDPGAVLLQAESEIHPGSVVSPVMHGSRCLLVELQALTATSLLGSAKRKASGIDQNRLSMLIAVLEKHGGLRLADQDVFASAIGGLRVIEPAADLALALAIAGAHYRRSLSGAVAVFGEVGLGGEVRPVSHSPARLSECKRIGYRTIVVSNRVNRLEKDRCDVDILSVNSVADAINLLV